VSNMTTRSFSDFAGVVMEMVLLDMRLYLTVLGALGFAGLQSP
jgi:hypothetical protein